MCQYLRKWCAHATDRCTHTQWLWRRQTSIGYNMILIGNFSVYGTFSVRTVLIEWSGFAGEWMSIVHACIYSDHPTLRVLFCMLRPELPVVRCGSIILIEFINY